MFLRLTLERAFRNFGALAASHPGGWELLNNHQRMLQFQGIRSNLFPESIPPSQLVYAFERAFGLAYSILGNYHDAADAVSMAACSIGSVPYVPNSFEFYILSVVGNAARKLRARRLRDGAPDIEGRIYYPETPAVSELAERNETIELVREAIESLPSVSRDVVWKRWIEQKGYGQIAEETNLNVRQVEGLLYRAMPQLRSILHKHAVELGLAFP